MRNLVEGTPNVGRRRLRLRCRSCGNPVPRHPGDHLFLSAPPTSILQWPGCSGFPCPRPARRLRGVTPSRLPRSRAFCPRLRCRRMRQIQFHPPRRPFYLVGYADAPRSGVHLLIAGPSRSEYASRQRRHAQNHRGARDRLRQGWQPKDSPGGLASRLVKVDCFLFAWNWSTDMLARRIEIDRLLQIQPLDNRPRPQIKRL
jgi:hypothetical protein